MRNGATAADCNYSSLPLTGPHLQHLLSRGLTEDTIRAAGLYSASASQVSSLLGFNPKTGGIVIPYSQPFSGEVVLSRVRPDVPPILDGKPAKYLSPRGAGNHLYFPPGAREWVNDPKVPFGITEGEFKVLWAYQAGLRYVGLVGVSGWRGNK